MVVLLQATSYEDIWDPNFRASSVKMAGSQPLLPLALSSGSIKSDAEMELLRQTLHQTGLQKEKEKLEIERRFRAELEKEKRLTSHLKVLLLDLMKIKEFLFVLVLHRRSLRKRITSRP